MQSWRNRSTGGIVHDTFLMCKVSKRILLLCCWSSGCLLVLHYQSVTMVKPSVLTVGVTSLSRTDVKTDLRDMDKAMDTAVSHMVDGQFFQSILLQNGVDSMGC